MNMYGLTQAALVFGGVIGALLVYMGVPILIGMLTGDAVWAVISFVVLVFLTLFFALAASYSQDHEKDRRRGR